jgi:hypothetical protein
MYIGNILVVQTSWRIETMQFAMRMFRPTGYQSNWIAEERDGSNLSRDMGSEN